RATSTCGSRWTAGSATTPSSRPRRPARTRSSPVPPCTGPRTRAPPYVACDPSRAGRCWPMSEREELPIDNGSGRPDLILVVDDDEDIARFVQVNLKLHGFEVAHAHDGEEALEVIEKRRPDLAVVDLMMPRVD